MSAIFSPCGRYRYRLERPCDGADERPPIAFVMLNPSSADAERDDPTIRRVRKLASGFGYGALTVVNLYALRTPSPPVLLAEADPIGPDNDTHLAAVARQARDVVCAWGRHADPARAAATLALLRDAGARLWHLGLTKSGAPRHPLYVERGTALRAFTD